MNLYLYIVANYHPEVMKRYKYLVLANSRQEAIDKMKTADGGIKDWCEIESCELQYAVECNVWYLPGNESEPLEPR